MDTINNNLNTPYPNLDTTTSTNLDTTTKYLPPITIFIGKNGDIKYIPVDCELNLLHHKGGGFLRTTN